MEKNEGLIGTFWKEYLDGYKYWELLSAEDKNIIYRFWESFGTLDIYSQINEIKMYEKRIEGNISDARQKMREQKKVCIFMGLVSLAGLILVFLWIVPYIEQLFETVEKLFSIG